MAPQPAALQFLWLLLLGASATAHAQRPPAPIGTSILITGFWDLLDGRVGELTPCESAVWKSAGGYNAKTITFVVTINAVGSFNMLTEYFYKGANSTWLSITPELAERWQQGLAKCFKAAVDAHFEVIHILPHVDPIDKQGRGMWRNVVKFSPIAKVGPGNGTSYHDALVVPVCNAINDVVPLETAIEFTVAGEQGLSVFSYPRRWMDVMDSARAMISRGEPRPQHSFGVSFNHNKVCGCVEPGESDAIIYNNTLPARHDNFTKAGGLNTIDLPGVVELLNSSDFIGVSAYSPMPLPTRLGDMERPAQTIAYELSFFNISLSDLLLKQDIKFVFSEQGMGGCDAQGRVAQNLTFLASHPWMGTWPPGGYSNRATNPWKVPLYAQYRRQFYGLLSNWAARGGGPQYRIDNIYLWNVGTWDILGVHHSSSNWQGSYSEPYLRNLVSNHNGYAHNVTGYDLSKVTASMPPGEQTVVDAKTQPGSKAS